MSVFVLVWLEIGDQQWDGGRRHMTSPRRRKNAFNIKFPPKVKREEDQPGAQPVHKDEPQVGLKHLKKAESIGIGKISHVVGEDYIAY